MFKNVMLYRLGAPWPSDVAAVEAALDTARFVPCGASQEKAVGWLEPRGIAHGPLVEVIGGQWLFKLMMEMKVVPGSVVKRKVEEQVAHIEATTGRKPGKKEKKELSEDARLALLPMAFSKQSSVQVWVDPAAGLLITDAGSQAKADEVMTWLIKAVDGLAVSLINTQVSPAAAMATWLSTKEAPADFTVDRECELKAPDESKAVVRYTRHALDTDEVAQHIAMGKMPTRLALTWNDRVSFVLTEGLQLKKIAFLEGVFDGNTASPGDGKADNFDTDAAIATGELQGLIPDLIEALGGEMPSA
ncbi:MAG: recombination-associated protein RdgC [Burkholderiales bacterium]|nr:recombination-associated protein RdgC [Burkholderiales bacterium]